MGINMYVSPSGTARKVKGLWVGTGDGYARRVKRACVGDSNGTARLMFCDVPTNITLYGGYGKLGYFDYEGQTYSKDTYATSKSYTGNSAIRIRKPTDTIRVYYDIGAYYDQSITADQSTNLYACPQYAKFWYGIYGPNGFSYNTGNVTTAVSSNKFYMGQNSIRYSGEQVIEFTAAKSGYLKALLSSVGYLTNLTFNAYKLLVGNTEYSISESTTNTTYSVYVSAGQTCKLGMKTTVPDWSAPGGFSINFDAIWFE